MRISSQTTYNTIQEPEVRVLVKELPDIILHFEEIKIELLIEPLSPLKPSKKLTKKNSGIPPEDIPLPEGLQGKMEQFMCIVERPKHWLRYLVTQKLHLRIMSPYGCVRLCKELGINKIALNLNNPAHRPEQ